MMTNEVNRSKIDSCAEQGEHGWLVLSKILFKSWSDYLFVLRDLVLKEALFRRDWVQLSPLSRVMERSAQLDLAQEAGEQGRFTLIIFGTVCDSTHQL